MSHFRSWLKNFNKLLLAILKLPMVYNSLYLPLIKLLYSHLLALKSKWTAWSDRSLLFFKYWFIICPISDVRSGNRVTKVLWPALRSLSFTNFTWNWSTKACRYYHYWIFALFLPVSFFRIYRHLQILLTNHVLTFYNNNR